MTHHHDHYLTKAFPVDTFPPPKAVKLGPIHAAPGRSGGTPSPSKVGWGNGLGVEKKNTPKRGAPPAPWGVDFFKTFLILTYKSCFVEADIFLEVNS